MKKSVLIPELFQTEHLLLHITYEDMNSQKAEIH